MQRRRHAHRQVFGRGKEVHHVRLAQLRAKGIQLGAVLRVARGGGEECIRPVGRVGGGGGEEDVARHAELTGLLVLLLGHRGGHAGGNVAVAPGDDAEVGIATADPLGRNAAGIARAARAELFHAHREEPQAQQRIAHARPVRLQIERGRADEDAAGGGRAAGRAGHGGLPSSPGGPFHAGSLTGWMLSGHRQRTPRAASRQARVAEERAGA
jgi:hypothetical protein